MANKENNDVTRHFSLQKLMIRLFPQGKKKNMYNLYWIIVPVFKWC